MWARLANAALGTWLALSSLILPQTRFQAMNDLACGVFAVVFAVGGLAGRPTRLFNVVIGTWLLASAILLPHASGTGALNQGAVGYLLIAFAFIPRQRSPQVEPSAPVNW